MSVLRRRWAVLALLLLMVPLTNCIGPDSGSESGTVIDFIPPDPDTYACDPFDEEAVTVPNQGVQASVYYLDEDQPRYNRVGDYITHGHMVEDLDLYLNQIYIPTRPFDRGFTTNAGQTITNGNGDTLYEYFALQMQGQIAKGSLPDGPYQVAVLSDDGAILKMDLGAGLETIIDNDGTHPTRMACADKAVDLSAGKIPYELSYYQGPRFHISMVVMVRPWPEDNDWEDEQCGQQGNNMYFNFREDPVTPTATYEALLSRGWKPLEAENYYLPDSNGTNPCNTVAPTISNVQIASFDQTTMTLTWETDVPATSQVDYHISGVPGDNITPFDPFMVQSHSVTVTGLQPNTTYVVKAVSKSSTGLSSESATQTVRTRR